MTGTGLAHLISTLEIEETETQDLDKVEVGHNRFSVGAFAYPLKSSLCLLELPLTSFF